MQPTEYRNSFLEFSLYIYILLCGFQNILHLPVFEEKLQVSDLWFLVILFQLANYWKKFQLVFTKLISFKFIRVYGMLLIAFLSINFIVCLINYSAASILDSIGKLYLVSMHVVFIACFEICNASNPQIRTFRAFIHLAVLVSVIGLIGWILSVCGIENITTEIYKGYPYFGDTHRIRAFSPTASFYISMVTIGIASALYEFIFFSKRAVFGYLALLMSLVAVLCFTKSFLFILLVWILFLLFKIQANFKYMVFYIIVILAAHLVTTHFLFITKSQLNNSNLLNGSFTSGEILYQSNNLAIAASSYYQLKKTSWQIFTTNPWWGIGPGNFNHEIAKLKMQGNYPAQLSNYDPHSTILGALAETGLFGFLVLIGLVVFYISSFSLYQSRIDPISFLLGMLLLIMCAEGLSMDVLNFRHYWLVLSLVIWNRIKLTN